MKFRSGQDSEIIDLNISSMIDLTFLLLIFFLIQFAKRQDERELKIPIPAESMASDKVPEVTEDFIVDVFPDDSIEVNGEPCEDSALASQLNDIRSGNPDQTITVRGQRETKHKRVVTVLDACAAANIEKISFPADDSVFEE